MAFIKDGKHWTEGGRRLTGSEILDALVKTAEEVGKARSENNPELGRLLSLEFELKHEILDRMDLPELQSDVPF